MLLWRRTKYWSVGIQMSESETCQASSVWEFLLQNRVQYPNAPAGNSWVGTLCEWAHSFSLYSTFNILCLFYSMLNWQSNEPPLVCRGLCFDRHVMKWCFLAMSFCYDCCHDDRYLQAGCHCFSLRWKEGDLCSLCSNHDHLQAPNQHSIVPLGTVPSVWVRWAVCDIFCMFICLTLPLCQTLFPRRA